MVFYRFIILVTVLLTVTSCTIHNEDGKVIDVNNKFDVMSFKAICFYPSGHPSNGVVQLYNQSLYQNLTYEFFGDTRYKCDAQTFDSQDFINQHLSI